MGWGGMVGGSFSRADLSGQAFLHAEALQVRHFLCFPQSMCQPLPACYWTLQENGFCLPPIEIHHVPFEIHTQSSKLWSKQLIVFL